MEYPVSTGTAARLLGVTEPQLGDLLRRGRVGQPPVVVAGRRQWWPAHLLEAARALELPQERLEEIELLVGGAS